MDFNIDKKIIKKVSNIKYKPKSTQNIINKSILNNDINNNIKWLVYDSYSCRYDSFLFIYIFCIKRLLEENNKYINDNIQIINIISNEILNANYNGVNLKIWDIIDKNKKNYEFLLYNNKDFNTIMQFF